VCGAVRVRAGAALFKRTEGFLIGNPGINSDWYFNINEYAFQTYLWSHGLLPEQVGGANIQSSLCSTLDRTLRQPPPSE
jgi:hypothetical protein